MACRMGILLLRQLRHYFRAMGVGLFEDTTFICNDDNREFMSMILMILLTCYIEDANVVDMIHLPEAENYNNIHVLRRNTTKKYRSNHAMTCKKSEYISTLKYASTGENRVSLEYVCHLFQPKFKIKLPEDDPWTISDTLAI